MDESFELVGYPMLFTEHIRLVVFTVARNGGRKIPKVSLETNLQ